MPKIYSDDDLLEGKLRIKKPLSISRNTVLSGYGTFYHECGVFSAYFIRYTDKRRLVADRLKSLFGLIEMDYQVFLISDKPYLLSISTDLEDATLSDFLQEELTPEEISDVRAIIFFRVMLGMVRNNEQSIIVRDEDGRRIFISRDDRFQTHRAICNDLQPSVTKKTLDKWIETTEVRDYLKDVPIWRNMTDDEIRESYFRVQLKIIDIISSIDPELLYMVEIINKYMISCIN